MNTAILRQSVKSTKHSKTDGAGIRGMHNDNALTARPGCHQMHAATCKPKGSKRKLPYEEIQRLHEQGLTGVAIAKQLGLKTRSVNTALRTMGLGTGQHKHKREVLSDGRIRCSVCGRSKKADEFPRSGSRCKPR